MPEALTMHQNSEGELIAVERCEAGPFKGQLLLVIYDDPPLGMAAPMLLDEGTLTWLADVVVPGLAGHSGGSAIASTSTEEATDG